MINKHGFVAECVRHRNLLLGGVYMFDAGMGFPDGPVRFLEPQWLEMFRHTVREAERLSLTFGVHNCDGFSQSGGPWIVRFPPGRGAPAEAHFEKLISWSRHENSGVRFSSGTATYETSFTAPADRLGEGRRLRELPSVIPSRYNLRWRKLSTARQGGIGGGDMSSISTTQNRESPCADRLF